MRQGLTDHITQYFPRIYGTGKKTSKRQTERYLKLIEKFRQTFRGSEMHVFSTPGRTEIGGNHTDHNHGRVLAAAINLDTLAVAEKTEDSVITLHSEGYHEPFVVELNQLKPLDSERGDTASLIRGIAARLKSQGYQIGGFNACMTSDVPVGSGLSSSASVEVLIGTVLNTFYNNGKTPVQDIARIGQFAENHFFGKPCGLMDQMTCAVGGIITIDFKDPAKPGVKKIDFDFKLVDYSVIVIDTGGSHADLTDDYGAIPQEMRSVADHFQAETCRELKRGQVVRNVAALREKLGDRPVLRALHFLKENRRVIDQVDALKAGNFARFLALVNDSGNSSAKWLQNSFSPKTPQDQGITMALALTELFLENKKTGACRVHGGGFAGTIQVFMPNENLREYQKLMESIFGPESITILDIRPEGTLYLGRL